MFRLWARVKKDQKDKRPSAPGGWTLRELFTGQRRNEVYGIACWAGSLLLAAAVWPRAAGHNALGPAGEIIFRLGFALAGAAMFCLPVLLAIYGIFVFKGIVRENPVPKNAGLGLLLLTGLMLLNLIFSSPLSFEAVPAFYAGEKARHFWSGLPPWLRLWGDTEMPLGGFPALGLVRLSVAVFSVIGTYIVCGTLLVLSFYLLEVEPYILNTLRKTMGGLGAVKPPSVPLQYACVKKSGKPSMKIEAPAKAETPAPAVPKIKINTPLPVERTPEVFSAGDKPALRPVKKEASEEADEADADLPAVAGSPRTYRLPGLELLKDGGSSQAVSDAYFETMSQTLEKALSQFGVSAKVVEVCPGPVVTRYELEPAPGVKVNRIISLADDIALAMKAEHVRIEAPIPGKGAVGIEIPNSEKQVVVLKELLSNPVFAQNESVLTFAVGKDIGGQHIFARLESMPHLLVAGATGSGKSACVNSIVCSLLYRATPREVRFLMIDPKRVELTMYNKIPHLKAPVITDSQQAAVALKLLVREMEDRYKLFAQAGVRDIVAFNQRTQETAAAAGVESAAPPQEHMPYIIVFIDEFADLMMVAANEVENAVTRLAQMARGVGIHLVLATQRPSVDVITGVIKANFPSRIAFQVSSKVDSRTILDANGADALLGRGDMLYSPASAGKPMRVQGVFVSTPEVERIATFWKEQGAPVFDPAFADTKLKSGAATSEEGGEEDELYSEAVSWVVRAKQASTSLLQRRLKIGYSRAARLLDLMEEKGVVGPPEGSKPRKVLVSQNPDGGEPVDLEEEAV
jgi:S-DNA-T family DNA segregation ATPase FtsK/SpoIIIE